MSDWDALQTSLTLTLLWACLLFVGVLLNFGLLNHCKRAQGDSLLSYATWLQFWASLRQENTLVGISLVMRMLVSTEK